MNIIEELQKFEGIEDQVVIGLGRVSRSIALVVSLVGAAKQANVGPDTNAILVEVESIGNKLLDIVGRR